MILYMYIGEGKGKPDKVSLADLLKAAGVENLEMPSDAINSKGKSFRKRGCILQVKIVYNNWHYTWFSTRYIYMYHVFVHVESNVSFHCPASDIRYEYQVRRIPYMDYSKKEIEPPLQINSSHRMLRKRYSLRVVFVQSGSIGLYMWFCS